MVVTQFSFTSMPYHFFFILKFTSTVMYRKGHLFSDQSLHDINFYKSRTNFSTYQSKWLVDTFFIYIKFSSILSDSSDSLKASWFDCSFLEQQNFFINIPRQNKQLRPIARAKVTEINPADMNRIKIIVNPGFASRTFWQSKSFSVQVDPNGWILHEQVTDPLNPHTFLFSVVLSAKVFICRKMN